jgi:hypothetical protein
MDAGIQSLLGVNPSEYHDDLIYTSMLQAGIKEFQFVGDKVKPHEQSFLKNKIEYYSFDEYHKLQIKVRDLLDLPKENNNYILEWFITELIHCYNTKTSMVSVFPMPKHIENLEKLDLKTYSLIKNLFDKISTVELTVPIPINTIPNGSIKVFEEIFNSADFDEYSKSHDILVYENTSSIINDIQNKSKSLHSKFDNYLSLKKSLVATIPSISSIIEQLYGVIPKNIFDLIVSLLSNREANDNMCIYDYGSVHLKLLTDYYKAKTGINFRMKT